MRLSIVIKIIGILFILIGFVFVLRPDIMKWLIAFIRKGSRVYFAALIRFTLAVIFLLGAGDCSRKGIIAALGILFLLAGLLIFMLGPQKIRRILDWYQNQPLLIFRFIAVVPMIFGAVIIFSA